MSIKALAFLSCERLLMLLGFQYSLNFASNWSKDLRRVQLLDVTLFHALALFSVEGALFRSTFDFQADPGMLSLSQKISLQGYLQKTEDCNK